MLHFFGFLFIIILAILLIGLSIIGTVVRKLFGLGGRGYSFSGNRQPGYAPDEETGTGSRTTSSPDRRKKLFSQDEGEYVDFEEIKEE